MFWRIQRPDKLIKIPVTGSADPARNVRRGRQTAFFQPVPFYSVVWGKPEPGNSILRWRQGLVPLRLRQAPSIAAPATAPMDIITTCRPVLSPTQVSNPTPGSEHYSDYQSETFRGTLRRGLVDVTAVARLGIEETRCMPSNDIRPSCWALCWAHLGIFSPEKTNGPDRAGLTH